MSAVTKVSAPSLATKLPPDTCKIGPYPIGEDIAAGDACYLKSDGKFWRSTAAAATAAAEVHGFAVEAALVAQRQSISLHTRVTLTYGSGLTPGAYLYLSASVAGGLDTASSANQLAPIGLVMPDGARVRVKGTF